MRILTVFLSSVVLFLSSPAFAQTPNTKASTVQPNVLTRHYVEGETLTYHMEAVNDHAGNKRLYQVDAKGVVRKDATGFYEEFRWLNLEVNGSPVRLDEKFQQVLSLATDHEISMPNISKLNSKLIGPTADLLTFYADLRLAVKQGLSRVGDHVYVNHPEANSWADGKYLMIAEDSVDFDITLRSVEASRQLATVVIRHVPPKESHIRVPVEWMQVPVTIGPNNWVQVANDSGKYVASIGNEQFEVELKVSIADGKILSATMDNPVEVLERECTDASLTRCGEARRYRIQRKIGIMLAR